MGTPPGTVIPVLQQQKCVGVPHTAPGRGGGFTPTPHPQHLAALYWQHPPCAPQPPRVLPLHPGVTRGPSDGPSPPLPPQLEALSPGSAPPACSHCQSPGKAGAVLPPTPDPRDSLGSCPCPHALRGQTPGGCGVMSPPLSPSATSLTGQDWGGLHAPRRYHPGLPAWAACVRGPPRRQLRPCSSLHARGANRRPPVLLWG